MPSQVMSSVENNFTKGLITESTGLNFPENAATDCDNSTFTLIGDVTRRLGINIELHGAGLSSNSSGKAVSEFMWDNPGGDSTARLLVKQIGGTLYFYNLGTATVASPISFQLLASIITVSTFLASGGSFDPTLECQYSQGNGFLFVFHPNCDPFYVKYSAGAVTASVIIVQIRDLSGVPDSLGPSDRPSTLSNEHQYNLINQGWSQGGPWASTSSTTVVCQTGAAIFTIGTGIVGISAGDTVQFLSQTSASPGGIFQPAGSIIFYATISSYTSGTGALAVNIYFVNPWFAGSSYGGYDVIPRSTGKISTWKTAIGNYPSNSDVWWSYKNSSDVFDPGTTVANVTLNTSNAPKGHVILNAFQQQRTTASPGITDITTLLRPTNGAWFQGRVWYTGVNTSQPATGDVGYYNWTENIYFSQINIGTDTNFGLCYQTNDPTSDALNGLLPTDGGVIQIQGSGPVYKLFPVQNGLLVFAANGVWFITGSQGIGFTANDSTVTKISSVKSISSTSFVNVLGLPYFWNEEGIYQVQPTQSGVLTVEAITVGTILSFFNDIPPASRRYVRGDYHPLDYVIQWVYRSTTETGIADRYHFNRILNYNIFNKAFYPYTVSDSPAQCFIQGVFYATYPVVNSSTPDPGFKYVYASNADTEQSIAEEYDTSYLDWGVSNYSSYFITGYKLHGQGQKRFQVPYVYVFTRTNGETNGYKIQGIWDYASNRNSGRWSTAEVATLIDRGNFSMLFRRHKIRGMGITLQFKITSVDGTPFDIMGWSVLENVNQGV